MTIRTENESSHQKSRPHRYSARQIQREIIDANLEKKDSELKKLFCKRMKLPRNEEALDAVLCEWWAANPRGLRPGPLVSPRVIRHRLTKSEIAGVTQLYKATIVEQHRHYMMHSAMMPNGKRLRDCTGLELIEMGREEIQLGDFKTRLGKSLLPDQLAGTISQDRIYQICGL